MSAIQACNVGSGSDCKACSSLRHEPLFWPCHIKLFWKVLLVSDCSIAILVFLFCWCRPAHKGVTRHNVTNSPLFSRLVTLSIEMIRAACRDITAGQMPNLQLNRGVANEGFVHLGSCACCASCASCGIDGNQGQHTQENQE